MMKTSISHLLHFYSPAAELSSELSDTKGKKSNENGFVIHTNSPLNKWTFLGILTDILFSAEVFS